MDSTFIESQGRHNTRGENETVKKGEVPKSFEGKTTRQRAPKDCDARRSMKNNAAYHGYGSHTQVDARYSTSARVLLRMSASITVWCLPVCFRKTDGERPGFLPTTPAGRRGRGGTKVRAYSVRYLRAGVRRAFPCRKAQKGERAQTQNAPPDRALHAAHGRGVRKGTLHGRGIARAKVHMVQRTPPAASVGFAIKWQGRSRGMDFAGDAPRNA